MQNAKLNAKFRMQNAKLNAKFRMQNAKLNSKFRMQNAKLNSKCYSPLLSLDFADNIMREITFVISQFSLYNLL